MEKTYDDSMLEDLFPHYDFYNQKGIDTEILMSLKGGLATQGQMYQRFVFPIYNSDRKIHGFSGRDMAQRDNAPNGNILEENQIGYIHIMFHLMKNSIQQKRLTILVR